MLFLTDPTSMNFIVNYNMLQSPNKVQSNKKTNINFENLKSTMQVIRNICAATNRPIEKLQKVFAPYKVDLSSFSSSSTSTSAYYKDKEEQNQDQSKFVFNQILSTDPAAKQVMSVATEDSAEYLPPRLHIGDIDADGFPDILVTL